MSVIYRVAISLIVALLCASFFSGFQSTGSASFEFNAAAFIAFALATLITTFLTGFITTTASADNSETSGSSKSRSGATGGRERGRVKWFNFSKGFGFISRDNGEEIFVHYRSIRGKGRRSLNDGQLVEFSVAKSDKGLQAEDVEVIKKS